MSRWPNTVRWFLVYYNTNTATKSHGSFGCNPCVMRYVANINSCSSVLQISTQGEFMCNYYKSSYDKVTNFMVGEYALNTCLKFRHALVTCKIWYVRTKVSGKHSIMKRLSNTKYLNTKYAFAKCFTFKSV